MPHLPAQLCCRSCIFQPRRSHSDATDELRRSQFNSVTECGCWLCCARMTVVLLPSGATQLPPCWCRVLQSLSVMHEHPLPTASIGSAHITHGKQCAPSCMAMRRMTRHMRHAAALVLEADRLRI